MLKALRDWLRLQSSLDDLDFAIHGDTTQGTYPRVRMRCGDDPRQTDLDGEGNIRQQNITLDIYTEKGQVAHDWSDAIEAALVGIKNTTTGGWVFEDVETRNATDGQPEPSPSGDDEPINRVSLEILLTGYES